MSRKAALAQRTPVLNGNQNFKIETGLDIPELTRVKRYDFPFNELKLGQSFFVPCKDESKIESLRATLYKYRSYAIEKADGELNFDIRKMKCSDKDITMGFRIWRVEA